VAWIQTSNNPVTKKSPQSTGKINPPNVFIVRSRMYRKLIEAGVKFMADPFCGIVIAVDTKPERLAV
jgi:hypothetical protein